MGYKARLKRMKSNYEGARKTAEEMFEDFPIGVFVMKLKGAEVGERTDESLYIMSKYIVTDDEEKGRQFTPFQNVNEDHLEYVHKYFIDHGVTPPEIENLEEALVELVSSSISVKMKVYRDSGGYVKGRILAVVETEVLDTETETETETEAPEEVKVGNFKEEFLELCEKCGINIPAKVQKKDVEEIAEFINATYDVDAKEMDEADVVIFESLNVELKNTKLEKAKTKAKTKTKEKDDDIDVNLLKEVCAGNGIDFEEDDTAEQLGERLSEGYKWSASKDELTEEQVAAMQKVDVTVKK